MTDEASTDSQVYASAEALALHRELTVFDCLALEYLLDPPYFERAIEGGVTATNVTVASEGQSWEEVLRNVASAHMRISRAPDLVLATTAQHIRDAKREGRLAVLLGTQGSEVVGPHLERVKVLHDLGVRYIGLAYTGATVHADGCGETRDAGLTFLGREFVAAVNALPMMLDLSHTGHRSRLEAAELADRPVCTHSNAFAVNANDRNTHDEAARVVAAKGGVMGVTCLVKSVAPQNQSIEHVLDHADHWVRTVGVEHTGIGLDFTEGYQDAHRAGRAVRRPPRWRERRPDIFGTPEEFYTQQFPRGLRSITQLPNLTHGLLERGHRPEVVAEIMGGAWLRNLEALGD